MMHNGVQCEFPPGYDGTVLLERLQPILDPELDESILQLGFIQSLHVYDGHAIVVVQLPTSWCAANFAYMMADDIRHALMTVEGLRHVTVRKKEYGVDLTPEIKRKILGENAARLYGIDIATQKAKLSQDGIGVKLAVEA